MVTNGRSTASLEQINGLLNNLVTAGIDFIKIETLCMFNGEPGYSTGHGQ